MKDNQNYFTANDFSHFQSSKENLFPCPTCKEKDQLTQKEMLQGLQCLTCKTALEIGYGW
jgi:hypothetical protein